MGSLMAGWDSHVHDPKSRIFERNRSMTKEEIATFWKSKKNVDDVHSVLKTCHTFSKGDLDQNKEIEKIYRRSNSLPITKENFIMQEDEEEDREKLFLKHGWWINSRWAFLNEPPVIASETPFRYASQFHVATQKHTNESDNGIRI